MKTEEPINPESTSGKDKGSKSVSKMESEGQGIWTAVIISVLLFVGLAVAFLITQKNNTNEIKALNGDKTFMGSLLHTQDSILNDYALSMDEIDSNIEVLTNRRRILVNESAGRELSLDKRKKIIQDIQYLNFILSDAKKQIADLSAKIRSSRFKVSGYEKKIIALSNTVSEMTASLTQLKQQLAKKDFEIVQLNLKVSTMDTKLKVQTSELNSMEMQLSGLDGELNKAYLVSGSYKELKDKGVIARSGGFMGVGGNVKMTSSIEDGLFKPIDIRHTKSIALSAKKAQFISIHPKDSYRWVTKENRIDSLEITNPNNFWKYTKYAVLETK